MLRKACLFVALAAAIVGTTASGESGYFYSCFSGRIHKCTRKTCTHRFRTGPEHEGREQQGQGGDRVLERLPLLPSKWSPRSRGLSSCK